MAAAVRLQPLLGVDFVGADDSSDLVVEDFGRRPRQCLEAGVLQAGQVLGQRHLGATRPLVTSSVVNPWMWMSVEAARTASSTCR